MMRQLVPTYILSKLDAGELRGEMTAVAMFADLSGFSSMSDALGRHGHHGSEMLAAIMHAVFEPLVRCVFSQGGFVIGYAGDAVTAVFPEDGSGSAAQHCVSAAVNIQRHFEQNPQQVTSFGAFPVSVKIGLSLGNVIWEIFQSADGSRATYCFRGQAMDSSAQAEHHAVPGEIWLDEQLSTAMAGHVRGEMRDDFFRLSELDGCLPDTELPEITDNYEHHLARFFSDSILGLNYRGEFRPVVNAFIDIPPQAQQGEQLQDFMRSVFSLQSRYDCFFQCPGFGDKGANLLVFWGAPVAHENDVERALNFLLDLQRETGIRFSAGVSYRLAYAGFIGSALREDYTGYGWGISLAARMMKSAAPGEIWVDDEVARRLKGHFLFSEPWEQFFKGFAAKQKVYLLLERKETREENYHSAFAGREIELARLEEFISPLWQGQFCGVLVVKGEAGVGKSRLVHAFIETRSLDVRGIKKVWCQSDEIVRQALNPFRYWLRARFGIDHNLSEAENRERFSERLSQIILAIRDDDELRGELQRTRSFLAALLNIYWDDSLYAQLDAEERHQNTFIALSVLLRCESLRTPLLLCIEDGHWMDADSREFLKYLLRSLTADENRQYPIAILLTARPEFEAIAGTEAYPVRELVLGGLDSGSLSRLAGDLLGSPASQELVDFLQKRAEGNPFFVEQVLQYLRDGSLIREHKGVFSVVDSGQVDLFSTDIQSILVARLDRLTREVKEAVQAAAVLGREFETRLLNEMLRERPNLKLVEQAAAADIWLPMSEIRYIFRHALMRDAAYSMQLHSRQRALHALACEAIEKLFEGELAPYYGELAYHAERAYLPEKAQVYLEFAGDAARDGYQNGQALDYYQRALLFAPETALEQRYRLHQKREKILAHWGQREQQKRELDALEALAESMDDIEKLFECRVRLLNYLVFVGDYKLAEDLAVEALLLGGQTSRKDLICETYLQLCQACFRRGKLEETFTNGNLGLELARQSASPVQEARLLNMLGLVKLEVEPAKAAPYFQQAEEKFRAAGDLRNILMPVNNLGNLAGVRGDFGAAQTYYEQALTITREVGNRKNESVLLNNLGWIAGMQGDYRSARAYGERNLLVCREVGEHNTETFTLINLSSYADVLGDSEAAQKYAEQGLDLARQSRDASAEAWAQTYLGNALFGVGQARAAQEAYQAALNIRRELGQGVLATEPAAGLARAALVLRQDELVRETVENILVHMQKDANLEGTDQPLRVYLNCYLVLQELRDPRARDILSKGYEMLKARAAGIADAAAREMFVQDVPFHREIMAKWAE